MDPLLTTTGWTPGPLFHPGHLIPLMNKAIALLERGCESGIAQTREAQQQYLSD